MSNEYIFSSESVGEGHPDKVCDTISDAILDAYLAQDIHSRVACETLVKSNLVVLGGEISSQAGLDLSALVREAIRGIGYVNDDDVFHADRVFVSQAITRQSPDIAMGVDGEGASRKATRSQGAGDQGLMFGYATDETPELMPAPIQLAHRLMRELSRIRKSGEVDWLRPDAKSQVSVHYQDQVPTAVTHVVVSTQHAREVGQETIHQFLSREVIGKVLGGKYLTDRTRTSINPTGQFVVGGPEGDAGLTGRKIIVDTYGGMGRHGGGAFSGKDPSKVDRSAAYMGRYVAKNIVASGLARRCGIQFAYVIGEPDPVSVSVDTYGTGTVADGRITRAVQEVFSLEPAGIVEQLDLLRPIFSRTTNYGHFGKTDDLDTFTWERTDRAEDLKEAVK